MSLLGDVVTERWCRWRCEKTQREDGGREADNRNRASILLLEDKTQFLALVSTSGAADGLRNESIGGPTIRGGGSMFEILHAASPLLLRDE